MLYERKYFGNGHGNFDDVDFILLPNDWVNLENARVGSTDKGVIGTIESIGSNVLLSSPLPSVTFVEIGSVEDTNNEQVIYFLKDIYGPWDKVICYDLASGTFYNVLFAAQVTGGMNLDKDFLIHSARVINGLLYWTDNLNQPRRINIKAGINLNHPGTYPAVTPYTAPMNAEVITLIRKPPVIPIVYSKITDAGVEVNQISNNAFRFTYQYEYRDGELSTLAPHSLLAPYNFPSETFNAIQLTVPFTEVPDQDVEIIDLIVIYADGEKAFIIKTWNKANPTEAAQIAAHVAGSVALTYEFANDSLGPAIDNATFVKPFESIPLLSEGLEQASDRLFLGRNLVGYNAPLSTSLTASIYSSGQTIVFGNYWVVSVSYNAPPAACLTYFWYFAYFSTAIDGTHPPGYYDLTATPLFIYSNTCGTPADPPTFPTNPISISLYTNITNDPSALIAYIAAHDSTRLGVSLTGRHLNSVNSTFFFTSAQSGSTPTDISVLKSDAPYRLGVVFYDQYLRQASIILGPKITTPDRTYADATSFDYGIQWNLATGPLPNEIPEWAYYYSVPITKNLRTSFFAQARAGEIVYATKDADGNYVFTSLAYADSNAGVAVKLDLLNGNGMGYSFSQGDILKIYVQAGSTVSVAVVAQSGDWVVGGLVNLGSLVGAHAFFELFTPVQQTASEFFYENGSIYKIVNPTKGLRSYSTTSSIIPGDVYVLTAGTTPNDYLIEAMSPNSTFWRNWFTNVGRIQEVVRVGQQYKQTSVKWSNTFIPGTITNGLSNFDSLDEKILPGEMGPLRKLQITSKVNNELGAVMLGICERETASMYLGETQLVGSAANAFIAQSTGVIGTVNILKGSFGTDNPESVTEFRGNVYWVDILNGKVIQYSLNGLFPISNYKMTRFWKLFSEQYLSMTRQEIEALGSRPFIFTTVDPHHWELLVTIPKLLETPPKGYLPDPPYTSTIYPFDIWDGQAKTLVYKINAEPNFWQGAYSYTQEGYVTVANKLFSFKYGQLYEHNNTDSYCNFNGVQYKSRLMFVCNQQPERPKVYNNAGVEANMLPTLMYFLCEAPNQQVSNLLDFDWQTKEGVFYSQIFRNVLTPSATGLKANALVTGEKLRTYAIRIRIEFSPTTFPVELRFISIGYQLSLGHTIPIQ